MSASAETSVRVPPPSISVIIPARNEERYLPQCVASVRAAARAAGVDCEIIVVSDASRDATVVVAERLGCTVVEVEFRSRARTRNAGARRAAGSLLLFLDADSAIAPSLVADSLAMIREGRAVLWFRQRPLERSMWWTCLFYLYDLASRRRPLFSPAILMTSAYFEASGGFDESLLSLEDRDALVRAWRSGRAGRCRAVVRTSVRRVKRFGYLRGALHLYAALRDPRRFEWPAVGA
jgi:glycosyltransferase involved in cell wall biosynthesis